MAGQKSLGNRLAGYIEAFQVDVEQRGGRWKRLHGCCAIARAARMEKENGRRLAKASEGIGCGKI